MPTQLASPSPRTSQRRTATAVARRWPTALGIAVATAGLATFAALPHQAKLDLTGWSVLLAAVVYLTWGTVRGDLHHGRGLLTAQAAAVLSFGARHPLQVHREPQLGATVFAFLNVQQPPFNDVRVRQALNYAVDRKRVVSLLGSQLAELTCQITPPGVPGYRPYCPYTVDPTPSGQWIGPDLPKAHALIDASGTKGEQIVLWSFPAFDPAAQYLRSLLDELEYHVQPHCHHERLFAQLAAHANTQIGMFGWFGNSLAEDLFQTLGCHFEPNPSHFCDPAIDAQVQQLQNQQPEDPAGSAALAAKIDHELTDAAPWIPLFTPIVANLTSARVGNYQVQGGNVVLDQLWIK